jgi:hypothetical protein
MAVTVAPTARCPRHARRGVPRCRPAREFGGGLCLGRDGRIRFCAVATDVTGDVQLAPLTGEPRTLAEWTTTFHLALVVLDPFTYESSWIIDTAVRILSVYAEADCRVGFIVTGTPEEARQFLGPLVTDFLVFADPDRSTVKAMGLERLPAFVHLNQNHGLETKAEGWDPEQWRAVAERLTTLMSWRRPEIPMPNDPVPFEGTLALG